VAEPICQKCWEKEYLDRPDRDGLGLVACLVLVQRFVNEHGGRGVTPDMMNANLVEAGCLLCTMTEEQIEELFEDARRKP
jgi:hypothetical protein